MRNLVRLAVLLLIAHALYRFVPVYIHYYQFKDAVAETALFAKDRTDTELVDRVMRWPRNQYTTRSSRRFRSGATRG